MGSLLTARQVAERCSVPTGTVWRWLHAGICPPPLLVGGYMRWPERAVEGWIEKGCPQTDPPDRKRRIAFRRADLAETEERAAEIAEQAEV